MNIVLTGFMASGKSVISQRLAEITGRRLIDTDEYIETHERTSINEIFKTHGEEYFRMLEKKAVEYAASCENVIISTGGGTVLDEENTARLRQSGILIYLAPDFEIIEKRVTEAAKTRPLMQNSSIEDIRRRFEARRPFYESCGRRLHITDNMTPDDSAREILNMIKFDI